MGSRGDIPFQTVAAPGANVQLAHADWLDAAGQLERASVDLVYADPPFNTGKTQAGAAGAKYEDTWPDTASYIRWLGARLEVTLPLLKETGAILLHVDWRTSHRVRVLLDDLLGEDCFVNHLVWQYGLGGSSPRRFARKHDDILFYARDAGRHYFEPPMVPATSNRMKGKLKKATDVLDIPSLNNMASERTGYPTQKPLALLELLVGACCPAGGMVFDPCMGSGTTLVAAARLGRNSAGCDVSEDAMKTVAERLASIG